MIQFSKPFFQNVNNKKTLKSEVEQSISAKFKERPSLRPKIDQVGHILLVKHVQDIDRCASWLTRTFCHEKYPKQPQRCKHICSLVSH